MAIDCVVYLFSGHGAAARSLSTRPPVWMRRSVFFSSTPFPPKQKKRRAQNRAVRVAMHTTYCLSHSPSLLLPCNLGENRAIVATTLLVHSQCRVHNKSSNSSPPPKTTLLHSLNPSWPTDRDRNQSKHASLPLTHLSDVNKTSSCTDIHSTHVAISHFDCRPGCPASTLTTESPCYLQKQKRLDVTRHTHTHTYIYIYSIY